MPPQVELWSTMMTVVCYAAQNSNSSVFLPVHEGRAKTIMIGTHKDHIAAAADTAVEYYGHSYGMCVVSKFKPLNSIEKKKGL